MDSKAHTKPGSWTNQAWEETNPIKLVYFAIDPKRAYQFISKYKQQKKQGRNRSRMIKGSIAEEVANKGISYYISTCLKKNSFLTEESREIVVKTVLKGGVTDIKVRKQIWKLLTETNANINIYQEYYESLTEINLDDGGRKKSGFFFESEQKETQDVIVKRIMDNYKKRNVDFLCNEKSSGLCQFLLEMGFKEEHTFWMMVYLIETALPPNYLESGLLSIFDSKLLLLILGELCPLLIEHFKHFNFDVKSLLENWFSDMFCKFANKRLSEIFIHHLIMEGGTGLYKVVMSLFVCLKRDLLDLDSEEKIRLGLEKLLCNQKRLEQIEKRTTTIFLYKEIIEKVRTSFFDVLNSKHNNKKQKETYKKPAMLRIKDFTKNLKVRYFDPFYGKKLDDKLKNLSKKPNCLIVPKDYKDYSNINVFHVDHDKSVVMSTNTENEPENSVRSNNDNILKRLEFDDKKSGFGMIFDCIDQDKDISGYNIKFEEENAKLKVNEKNLINRPGHSLNGHRSRKVSIFGRMDNNLDDMVIYRPNKGEYSIYRNGFKQAFFSKNKQIFDEYRDCDEEDEVKGKLKQILDKGSRKSSKKTANTKHEINDGSRKSKRFLSFDGKQKPVSRNSSIKIRVKPKQSYPLPDFEFTNKRREQSLNLDKDKRITGFLENFDTTIRMGWKDDEGLQMSILP